MKNGIVKFLSILAIIFSSNLYAQGEAAVPFLLIDASPALTGMAGAVVALPTTDVYGAWYNPAQLGNFSRSNNIGFGFYPFKTEWLPEFNFSDLTWNSYTLIFGHTFKSKTPIYGGLGYTHAKIDLGENVWTDENGNILETFNSYETSNALSLGAGLDYYVQFNVGLTYKYISSELRPSYIQVGYEVRGGNTTASAFDFGLLINAPVMDLIFSDENSPNISMIYPFLNVSLGYTLLNLGNEISYVNTAQADPLPRQGKLGYGISCGLKSKLNGFDINIFQFDYSLEAHDFLFTRSSEKDIEYQSILGDINVIDNVFLGKSNSVVDVVKGGRIKIFNTIQYSFGSKLGDGYHSFNTSGYLLSSEGLLLLLASLNSNSDLNYIANHFILEYSWSKYEIEYSPADNTEFRGLQFKMFGFW